MCLFSATSFRVSLTGTAATAPTPPLARAITPSMVPRLPKGRAASCTSRTLAPGVGPRSPARTDCARVSPPGTSPSRSPPSFASQSGGCWTWAAGSATTTCTTSGCDVNGRSARNSIGTPWIGRNCLGSPGPARTPAPAATITTPTSGRDAAGELTDPVQRDELDPRRAGRDPGPRRAEDAAEALARGLRQPPLHAGYRAYLAAQPDLAQEQRVGRERAVPHARHQRCEHRQIRGRLDQADPARHIDEHVQLPACHAAAALQHREQDREPAVIEAGRDPLRPGPACLARRISGAAHSRTWPTLPGAPSSSSV